MHERGGRGRPAQRLVCLGGVSAGDGRRLRQPRGGGGREALTPLRHALHVHHGPAAVAYEHLVPLEPTARPTLVLVHGGSHTGACYLRTPDGRPGWAHRFVQRGFPVVVADWPGHGRSGAVDPDRMTGELVAQSIASLIDALPGPVVLVTHSMSGAYGWRVLELLGPRLTALVGVAPAQPGNIQAVPDDGAPPARAGAVTSADDPFVTEKLVGRSTRFPRAHLAAYAASLTPTAPALLRERRNTGGSQLRVADPSRLAGAHVLVLTGTDDRDHPREMDAAIVSWLNANGVHAEFVWLADRGISGNGHMLMLEDNSDALADLVADWLDARMPSGTAT